MGGHLPGYPSGRVCRGWRSPSETIGNVFRNRRLTCLVLGLWLGAGIGVDLVATQGFAGIDRFLAAPGSSAMAAQIRQSGPEPVRRLLRRQAVEENAWVFENWEWLQILIAVVFFLMVLLGERPPKSALIVIPAMLAVVVLQRFLLTPHLASLGRDVEELPPVALANNPTVAQFRSFHSVYAGCEVLKLLLGLGVGARLMFRHSRTDSPPAEVAQSRSEERVRVRRRTNQHG